MGLISLSTLAAQIERLKFLEEDCNKKMDIAIKSDLSLDIEVFRDALLAKMRQIIEVDQHLRLVVVSRYDHERAKEIEKLQQRISAYQQTLDLLTKINQF
jgi:hypothetical protein